MACVLGFGILNEWTREERYLLCKQAQGLFGEMREPCNAIWYWIWWIMVNGDEVVLDWILEGKDSPESCLF